MRKPKDAIAFLSPGVRAEVLLNRKHSFDCILCAVIFDGRVIVFFYDGHRGERHFTEFQTSGTGLKPDFTKMSIKDYGHTLAFGEYEACSDVFRPEEEWALRWKRSQRCIST